MAQRTRAQRIKDMERFVETTGREYGRTPMTRPSRPTQAAIDSSPGFWGEVTSTIRAVRGAARAHKRRLRAAQTRAADRHVRRQKILREFRGD
jgi:hypothetical protein